MLYHCDENYTCINAVSTGSEITVVWIIIRCSFFIYINKTFISFLLPVHIKSISFAISVHNIS